MTDVSTLTKTQSRALEFIKTYYVTNGYGPSYAEIASALGLKAKSGAHRIVHDLCERGVLVKRRHTARDFRIVDGSSGDLKELLSEALDYVDDAELRAKIKRALGADYAA